MSTENATDVPSSSARKLGLSCAECRRSKLKCDRVFPCQSCIRRGCAGICPEGTLAATKGNKVLMAHAQRLQEEVKSLSARCEKLEEQLAQAKGADPGDLHHFLGPHDRDLSEPLDNVSEGFGSLSIGIDGQAKYHGETSSSEYFQDLLPSTDDLPMSRDRLVDLPPDIIDLMNAFPFGIRDSPYAKGMFLDYVPDCHPAQRLVELYFINIGWMYEPITREDFRTSVFDVIYRPNGEKSVDLAHPHRLALFFIILASGCLFHEDPETVAYGKVYEALARASFSLGSILSEATAATVQTLFLLVRFIYSADRDRNEERWLLTGLNCRIAHMIGLQRDSANWNLPSEDVQRRRRCFWELFVWDAWTSVVNGRPSGLAIQFSDCQFPDDVDPQMGPDTETEMGWHAWKIRYAANILSASNNLIFSPRPPPYKTLLDLDKKIRSFAVPNHLRSPLRNNDTLRSWNPDPSRAMMQYCAICLRESNILYIHRSYFALALKQQPDNPLHHAFAASVLAAYRSATRLIASLRSLCAVHPQMASTVWYFWSGIFSSCIVLGALVVESPKCTLALDSLRELQAAVPFYEKGSRASRSHTTMPILEKLLKRATAVYNNETGHEPDSSGVDELQVLGGHKTVIKESGSSNASLSSLAAPNTPASRILDDSDDGNSPSGSHAGAMEMLQAYSAAIGMVPTPPPRLEHSRSYGSYDGGATRSRHSDEMAPSSGMNRQIMSGDARMPYDGPFMAPPGSTSIPDLGLGYQNHLSQLPALDVSHHGARTHHEQQQHYAYQGHPQQQYSGQQWGLASYYASSNQTAYGYGNQPRDPLHNYTHRSQGHGYGFGEPLVERTQEEIWRDFMMGYQQSG